MYPGFPGLEHPLIDEIHFWYEWYDFLNMFAQKYQRFWFKLCTTSNTEKFSQFFKKIVNVLQTIVQNCQKQLS
jgi:hypothetical protein